MSCLFARCVSQTMERFYFQLCLLILLIVISDCRAASPDVETASGHQEEVVRLSCFNSNVTGPKSCYRVKLKKHVTNTTRMELMFMWPKKRQDAKRVKWEADGDGRGCLYLLKLQKSDEGLYTCEIWQGWDIVLTKNVSLRVKDCKGLPPVTAAPSTSVQLSCPVNVTSGQKNVSWGLQKGNSHVTLDSNRVKINGTSLAIQSVTTGDSGWYRCSHTLGKTQRCFVTNLQVQEVRSVFVTTTVPLITAQSQPVTDIEVASMNRTDDSGETWIALTVSIVLGLIIIAALIGLVMYRRSKNRSINYRDRAAETTGGYECVDFIGLPESANVRTNSLYQSQDDSLYTFQY
ncbi:uncharacterized protein LOC103368218 isoform X2 [Stegastes partitus]|uniref:Uncharacterized protein LOC103368218 isoform X2 n=1 Tax=Stegastes partitus TaxID=144197 RepID=A0A9Y4ND99_9TELE|nr:PREDICTED: uncharacterized protein LOC103368218 isoform X2 [Stegastes partitus]